MDSFLSLFHSLSFVGLMEQMFCLLLGHHEFRSTVHLAWRGQVMSLHFICHAIEKDKRMNRDRKLTFKSIARVFDVTRALFDTYQARTLPIELFRFSLNIILNNELICTYLFKSSTQTPKTHGLLRQANPADTDCGPLTRMLTAIDRTIPML